MEIKVVNLAGPASVGKSTTSKSLVKLTSVLYPELKVGKMAFADPIYNITHCLTGIPVETLKSQEYKNVEWTKETSPMPCLIEWTPRHFLQKVGTECFRDNIDNNFWVDSAIRQAINNGLDIVFMEDSRFPNEFEAGHINIELKRNGIDYACNHASAMPPNEKYIDFVIELYPNINLEPYVHKIIHLIKEKQCGM